ncbi:hypothetical protein PRIPAC_88677, partial [Pristionchus pacificus]
SMLRLLLFFLLSIPCYAEPPNLLFQGVQEQRKFQLAMRDHSSTWEQMIVHKESIFDARKIIDVLGENSDMVSTECAHDIDLYLRSIIALEFGTLEGDRNLTDFDREVILPMLDSAGRIGPAILRGHTY